jgi:O-acetyl-ADP-ribose deacetylase (regulator of RNase III)
MATRDTAIAIRYVEGDATEPIGSGQKIIVHVCNDIGRWGKGFVLAVSRRWKEPERVYRESFREACRPSAGDVQFVRVSELLTVANLIGQRGITADVEGLPPVRYEAMRAGLSKVAAKARAEEASVHMPRIGCGLAGGQWARVEEIVMETLVSKGVDVTVYDYTAARQGVATEAH